MATFKESYRLERVYFEKLKSMIDILRSFLDSETDTKARAILENGIDADGAILLLYRNLGECWAELADLIQKLRNDLTELDEKEEAYHDELNERIDEVNNYLMALIRELEARMDAVEADLAQMGRLYTYQLNYDSADDEYSLTESGNAVTFESTVTLFSHVREHFVPVRGEVDGETLYFMPREYDLDDESGVFEWYSFGFAGNEIHETTVTLLPDDSVNVAVVSTNFSAILSRLTALEGRVTDLEECCDDVQEALDGKQDVLTAGENITIENNVISATGGGVPTITPTVSDPEPWPTSPTDTLYISILFENVEPGKLYLQGDYNLPEKIVDEETFKTYSLYYEMDGSAQNLLDNDFIDPETHYMKSKFYETPICFMKYSFDTENYPQFLILSFNTPEGIHIFSGEYFYHFTKNQDGTYNIYTYLYYKILARTS